MKSNFAAISAALVLVAATGSGAMNDGNIKAGVDEAAKGLFESNPHAAGVSIGVYKDGKTIPITLVMWSAANLVPYQNLISTSKFPLSRAVFHSHFGGPVLHRLHILRVYPVFA
jgi:hypothetical protein